MNKWRYIYLGTLTSTPCKSKEFIPIPSTMSVESPIAGKQQMEADWDKEMDSDSSILEPVISLHER